MRDTTKVRPIIFFAINTTLANEKEYIEKALECKVKQVIGCYRGKEETTYIVSGNVKTKLFMDLVRKHEQECILIVDKEDNASLRYLDDHTIEHIGTFQQVPEKEAKQQEAWTLDPVAKQFYICK